MSAENAEENLPLQQSPGRFEPQRSASPEVRRSHSRSRHRSRSSRRSSSRRKKKKKKRKKRSRSRSRSRRRRHRSRSTDRYHRSEITNQALTEILQKLAERSNDAPATATVTSTPQQMIKGSLPSDIIFRFTLIQKINNFVLQTASNVFHCTVHCTILTR